MPVVNCPSCRQALTVPDGAGGAVVTCPACQQPMTLPNIPPAAAAPAVVAAPDFIDPFAVPAPEPRRPRDRDWERDPEPARGQKTNWLPIALVGGAGVFGLIGVVIVVWLVAGGSKPTPAAKDKQPEQARADRPAPPQPKAKAAEPLAATGGVMDGATLSRIKKATVYIRIADGRKVSSGSGFFVDKSLVVTNHHVINNPGKMEVVTQSGTADTRTYPARLLFQDALKDLAVIEVEGASAPGTLTVGDTAALRETQEVFAFGFPLGERIGQEITVTKTTVSSIRAGGDRKRREVQLNGGLEHGNSGGPVTDATGRVIGVAVSRYDNTSVHFAIAAEEVQLFLSRFER